MQAATLLAIQLQSDQEPRDGLKEIIQEQGYHDVNTLVVFDCRFRLLGVWFSEAVIVFSINPASINESQWHTHRIDDFREKRWAWLADEREVEQADRLQAHGLLMTCLPEEVMNPDEPTLAVAQRVAAKVEKLLEREKYLQSCFDAANKSGRNLRQAVLTNLKADHWLDPASAALSTRELLDDLITVLREGGMGQTPAGLTHHQHYVAFAKSLVSAAKPRKD